MKLKVPDLNSSGSAEPRLCTEIKGDKARRPFVGNVGLQRGEQWRGASEEKKRRLGLPSKFWKD